MIECRPCTAPKLAATVSAIAALAGVSAPIDTLQATTSDSPPEFRESEGAEPSETPIAPVAANGYGMVEGAGGSCRAEDSEKAAGDGGSDGALQGENADPKGADPTSRKNPRPPSGDDGNGTVGAADNARRETEAGRISPAGLWSASAESEPVRVLAEWGGSAGFAAFVERHSGWSLDADFSRDGKLREAAENPLAGFATAAVPPVVVFHSNDVMTIGAGR